MWHNWFMVLIFHVGSVEERQDDRDRGDTSNSKKTQ